MNVWIQSWVSMMIQIYINGRKWLCRQLDEQGIEYERYQSAIVEVEDLDRAKRGSARSSSGASGRSYSTGTPTWSTRV